MRILLSNDDGVYAPGLVCLHRVLAGMADITVVAPDRNRSGASNSLTLTRPLRMLQLPNQFISIDGTPTDCVHVAVTGLLEKEPDMVVAGINEGGNLGDDVIYSGTVAAATEGRSLGFPAMAVSLVSETCEHYETAAQVAKHIIQYLQQESLPTDTILNVNVPDVPYAALKGYQITRLGSRHRAEPVVKTVDPRGRLVFWVGQAGASQDAGVGTDFHAIAAGFVSITPLQIDLTRYQMMDTMQEWVKGL